MYLIGAPHPHKTDAQRRLESLVMEERRLVTDSEVLQEILHRYRAIERPDAIQPAFDALLGLVDEIFPVEAEDVDTAKGILLSRWSLSARDALHVAVMNRRGIHEILTFDSGFDVIPDLTRLF